MKLFDWIQDLKTHPETTGDGPEHLPRVAPILQARLVELEKIPVSDMMTPRSVIMALDADVQLRRVRRLKSSKTIYFPVYKGDLDHILGWISKQKVLELLAENNDEIQINQFVRAVGIVNDHTRVADLADAFLKSASPFLVVKNSQGSTVGVVQLSDFVSLLFGFEIDGVQYPASEFSAPPLLRSHEI